MLHLRKPSAALTVSPSALVLLAAFLLLSRGLTLPAALLSAALCHELAHVLTLHALHAPPRRLALSATGAELYVPAASCWPWPPAPAAIFCSGRCCP